MSRPGRRLALLGALVLLVAPPAGALLLPVEVALPCGDAPAPLADLACGTWARRPDLPAAREGLGLAVAPAMPGAPARAYAFGGAGPDGAPTATFWSHGAGEDAWQAAPGGPPARREAVLAAGGGALWLFGGRDAAGPRGDLWRFDLAAQAWQVLAPSGAGPSPHHGAAGAWDPDAGRLWVFGGAAAEGPSAELWAYDPGTGTWALGADAPVGRSHAAAVWDTLRGGLLLHGGRAAGGEELADTWLYQPALDLWRVQTPAGRGRAGAAAAWWPEASNLLLAGGTVQGAPDDGAWAFGAQADDGEVPVGTPPLGVWLQQRSAPSARAGAAGAWHAGEGAMYVAGGAEAAGALAEVWAFTPGTVARAV